MFELPAEAFEPEFIQLLAYWRGKAPPGRLPGRQHIDPVELPPRILPRLLLLSIERGVTDMRYRFRLAGTGFAELVGQEVTGLCCDEIGLAVETAPLLDTIGAAIETRQPAYRSGPLTLATRHYGVIKRLSLPLAEDGETVDMVLASFLPVGRPVERGQGDGRSGRVLPFPRGEATRAESEQPKIRPAG